MEEVPTYQVTIKKIIRHQTKSINVHVHRPPTVTLNETPEEFNISTGLL